MKRVCIICGKEFESTAHYRKYCDVCQKRSRKKPQTESDPIVQPEGTVNCKEAVRKKCRYSTCVYGTWICEYIVIEHKKRKCPVNACDKFRVRENA